MPDQTNTAALDGAKGAAENTPAPGGGLWRGVVSVVLAVLASAGISIGVGQFVLLPRLEARLESHDAEASLPPRAASANRPPAGGGNAQATTGFRFENVVVNLAGTMGTRYLKTSFLVSGTHPELVARFDAARPLLGDVTLGTLSSLTLADLEEPGSKNIIRERLIDAYNRALGERMADNLFFSEFVVQ
jgi:flagellar protein FliL